MIQTNSFKDRDSIESFLETFGFNYFCYSSKDKRWSYANYDTYIGINFYQDQSYEFFFTIENTDFSILSEREKFDQDRFIIKYNKFKRVVRWYDDRWNIYWNNLNNQDKEEEIND